MGDLNAKIGDEKCENLIRDYGLGKSEEREVRFVEFIEQIGVVVINGLYKLPPRKITRTNHHKIKAEEVDRDQIDLIMIRRRHRISSKSAKA